MQIDHSSELMTNQKHAVAMAPQAGFRLAQTRQAHGLIFSIGTDAIFYRTLEQPRSRAGWALRDESSALATRFGSGVAAKLFDLSQNLADARLNLALAVTVAGADRLVLALNHANGDEDWELPLEWEEVPFDATDGPSRLVITGIYLAQHGRENATVVDILQDPDDPLRRIERFVIAPPGSTPRWQRHELAITLSADAISSRLGRKGGQQVDGIYTLGRLAETRELTYAQLKHPYGGNPMVSRFPLPPGSDAAEAAFALGANADGTTDLYLAAAGGLYYLAAGEQRDLAEPRRIAQHALLQDVTDLAADVQGRKIVVWGLNRQGQVFCLRGTVGQQGLEGAWSVPLPVLQGTLGVATLINRGEGGSVILAHGDDDRLIQLTEDPDTTLWSQRDIVLPPTAVSDVLSVTTYTTHVQVSDSNLPVADQEVAIWASGPCLVYINSLYHRLSPDTPTLVRSDANGTLTIVQQVDDIGVATYTLEAGGESVVADPMQRVHDKLSKVSTGADLDVTLHDSQGRPRPLVGPGITGGQKEDTARGIAEFIKVGKTLPADGSPRGGAQAYRRPRAAAVGPAALQIFGARFTPEGGSFFEGWEAAARAGLRLEGGALLLSRPDGALEDAGDAIAVAAGDLFRWIRHAAHEVEEFFVAYEQDVAHFFVRLAGKLYRMLITCLRDIANGVNFLLQKIEVALHDLVAWLGYLFQWPDIVRTHRVLKTLMHCFVRHAIDQLPVLRDDVEKAFRQIEKEIESWTHLTPIPSSANGVAGSSAQMPGQHDPQSNWGAYHLKDNATSSETGWRQTVPDSSPLLKLLEELKAMLEREETVFRDALEQLQTDVFDQLRTLPVTDILQRVVGIVLEAVLGTVENVLVTAIDIYTTLAEGMLAMLETPIDIPVISQIYREATGDALTVLDAACLVAAIPVTLLYKLTDSQHETPFPDDDFTRALIAARDMQELRAVLQGGDGVRALRTANYRKLEKVCAICAIPAAAVLCFVTPFRDAFSDNWALAVIGTVTYVVYCAPNLPAIVENTRSKWYNGLDFGITCFSIGKAIGDVALCSWKEGGANPAPLKLLKKFSPGVEFVVNLAWFAPVIGSLIDNHAEKDILNAIGNSGFNIGGMAALPMSFDDPRWKAAGLVIFIAGDVVYGYMNLLVASLLSKPEQAAPLAPLLPGPLPAA